MDNLDSNKIAIGAGALVLVAIVGYLVLSNRMTQTPVPTPVQTPAVTETSPSPAPEMKMMVDLAEQNNSSQSGKATLKEVGGKVMVILEMMGASKTAPQPAHIHMGACPKPGEVKYPLTSVVGGKSETTLSVTLTELKAGMPLAVNVHKSAAQSGVYVACGNLK